MAALAKKHLYEHKDTILALTARIKHFFRSDDYLKAFVAKETET